MHIAEIAWKRLVHKIITHGTQSSPRGLMTYELLGEKTEVDMKYPVVINPTRKLGYRFMAAEAAWILSGDNRVATIQPYSKEIENFSDDGLFFFGAYGVQFREQLRHVLRALEIDQDSRQAVITLWRPNPPTTKDVPCTISLHWMIRGGELHCFADMRSSDVWLGVPYDWFNFTMMTAYVLLLYRERTGNSLDLGTLHFYAHSQHLYDKNHRDASNLQPAEQYVPEFHPLTFTSPNALILSLWDLARDKQWYKSEVWKG